MSLVDQANVAISRNLPYWTAALARRARSLVAAAWKLVIEMFHDAIGR